MDSVTIGRNVKQARERRQVSQEQLARKLGVTHMTVSRLERGVVKDISVRRLSEIADALEVPLRDLVGAL